MKTTVISFIRKDDNGKELDIAELIFSGEPSLFTIKERLEKHQSRGAFYMSQWTIVGFQVLPELPSEVA